MDELNSGSFIIDSNISWADVLDWADDMKEAAKTHNRERLADDVFYFMAELACGKGRIPSPFSWDPNLGLVRSFCPGDERMSFLAHFFYGNVYEYRVPK